MAFGNTLRPEPVVALLAVLVLASCVAYLTQPATDLLVLAVLAFGLAVTVHPAGVVAASPMVVCLPRIIRDARARDPISFARLAAVLLIGAAWTLLLAFLDADQRSRETDAELIRSTDGHTAGVFQELQRYGGLGDTGGSPVRRLFAFLLLVAALAGLVALLRRRRPLAASLPAASVALSLLFLSLTPSKWIWHFGALIGVGAVAIGFETFRLAEMQASTRARAAFAVTAVGVASIASIEANHAGPLDTARLDWSVTPAWYLLAVIVGGGGAIVARQLGLTRRASLVVLPAVLASVMGMTMFLLAADSAATNGWTTPRQAMSSLLGRDACGVASDLDVAIPARARIATTDAPTPGRQVTAAGVAQESNAPVVLDAAGTTRWYEVGKAPIGLFIGGTWGPRQSLFVMWGRRNASGVQRLRSGHADLRRSTEGPDFARWRFVNESSFPTRPSDANAVRFRLGRTSHHSSARITSPTTSVHLPLSRLLGRTNGRSLVSPFLFQAMPCAALPALAEGLAEPPDFLVDFDPAPPLTAPTSPFVGLLEIFDLERLPVRSHVDRGSLFVYRVRTDSRDAVALAKKTVVS
jgi:hypothetical protein